MISWTGPASTRRRMAGRTPRPDVREDAPGLGDLVKDFDFDQAPTPPLILRSGPPWGPVPAEGSTPTDSVGSAPLTVDFDGSASTAPRSSVASWDLSFGDGSPDATGSGRPPRLTATHTYQQAGSFTAMLTITNAGGQTASYQLSITVDSTPPVAVLAGSAAVLIAPSADESFSSAGTSSPETQIASWDLNYGDGRRGRQRNWYAANVASQPRLPDRGVYVANLILTDTEGDTESDSFTVNVETQIQLSQSTMADPGSLTVTSAGGFMPGEAVNLDVSSGQTSENGALIAEAEAGPQGQLEASVVLPSTLGYGTWQVTATGQTSGAVASADLTLDSPWPEFGYGPAHGGVNPYETEISPSNVANLKPASWWASGRLPDCLCRAHG